MNAMMFVDGSHFFSALKHIGMKVTNYDLLFRETFFEVMNQTKSNYYFDDGLSQAALKRVYWHVVGHIDDWDLSDPKAMNNLREKFERDHDLKALWVAAVYKSYSDSGKAIDTASLSEQAWNACARDFSGWYEKKKANLGSMYKFFHAVDSNTKFIDIRKSGRWCIDFVHKNAEERGIDTAIVTDMLTMANHYDMAIVISNDTYGIPAIDHLKRMGKQVCLVEFKRDSESAARKQAATALRSQADIVVDITAEDIIRFKAGEASKIGSADPVSE